MTTVFSSGLVISLRLPSWSDPLYATRMLVKPGITGPWQVSGRSDLSAEESEALDVAYVQNWSIMGDIVLLFRTVGAVLSHKGAY